MEVQWKKKSESIQNKDQLEATDLVTRAAVTTIRVLLRPIFQSTILKKVFLQAGGETTAEVVGINTPLTWEVVGQVGTPPLRSMGRPGVEATTIHYLGKI